MTWEADLHVPSLLYGVYATPEPPPVEKLPEGADAAADVELDATETETETEMDDDEATGVVDVVATETVGPGIEVVGTGPSVDTAAFSRNWV